MESSIVLQPYYNLDEADLACAQDPLCEIYTDVQDDQSQTSHSNAKKTSKTRVRRHHHHRHHRCSKRDSLAKGSSYVISREAGKGRRVVKIKIIDTEFRNGESQAEEGHTLVSAQYIVKEAHDDIMDQTEALVHNISKKLCGYSFYVF